MSSRTLSSVRSSVGARTLGAMALMIGSIVGPVMVSTAVADASAPASASVPPVTVDPVSSDPNPFIPNDVNLSDCVNLLPRPDCGSDQRGGYHQYLTFIILLLATVFIGWRVARGVRARDRETAPPPKTPASKG